jgi:chorismate-pyruvate lyase
MDTKYRLAPSLLRQRFASAAEPVPHVDARALLHLLLHQDGSTTRLLELLAGGDITVHVLAQDLVRQLPSHLASALPGRTFLRRLTSLEAHGCVLLDSLSYIAVEALPASAVQELVAGVRPIGHVLAGLWTRRSFRDQDTGIFEELWAAVGEPDPPASRSTLISTPAGACMVLAETFRRGVLDLAERGRHAPRPGAATALPARV